MIKAVAKMNYIELHRKSDHTDPRVQARRSVLNLKLKFTKTSTGYLDMSRTQSGAIIVKQPAVRQV